MTSYRNTYCFFYTFDRNIVNIAYYKQKSSLKILLSLLNCLQYSIIKMYYLITFIFITILYYCISTFFMKTKFTRLYVTVCSIRFKSKDLASHNINTKSFTSLLSSDLRADKYDKAIGKKKNR